MNNQKINAESTYDILGVGAGPFNLSLLSLLQKTNLRRLLIEKSPEISWHSEIIFKDSIMQTSFLKDLVTSADPTNPYSFLNYLVSEGLFYLFMNTNRTVVTRKEYENYLKWVAKNQQQFISFNENVKSIQYHKEKHFIVQTENNFYTSTALCLGNGLTPRIPSFAKPILSDNCFHAKSPNLKNLNLSGKNVVIIGGGQTGLEIFRNILNNKWGNFASIKLISQRANLLPLDESPFTNEYFTPSYVHCFYKLDDDNKDRFLSDQKLASDGNTPSYLEDLYRDLYQMKIIDQDPRSIEIMPNRKVSSIEENGYLKIQYFNQFTKSYHSTSADLVILATGFEQSLPSFLNPILSELHFDELGRLVVNSDFSLSFKNRPQNKKIKIFVQNYSKHLHGISEPQTSLMPWRSATIINQLTDTEIYKINNEKQNFINFCRD